MLSVCQQILCIPLNVVLQRVPALPSVREVHRTRRTCPANFQNVRRRAAVKFNQMSGEKLQMSGEAEKDFAYTDYQQYI